MNPKRNAREFAFQFLYHLALPVFESDRKYFANEFNFDALKVEIDQFRDTSDVQLTPELFSFSQKLIQDVLLKKDSLDKMIEPNLKKWKMSRLSKVDYTALLIGAFELSDKKEPAAIVINEAVELAKKFGSAESPKFVNGLLDQLKS